MVGCVLRALQTKTENYIFGAQVLGWSSKKKVVPRKFSHKLDNSYRIKKNSRRFLSLSPALKLASAICLNYPHFGLKYVIVNFERLI
jgi:hypothetical protein